MNPYIISCPNMYDMLKAKVDFGREIEFPKKKIVKNLWTTGQLLGHPLIFWGITVQMS